MGKLGAPSIFTTLAKPRVGRGSSVFDWNVGSNPTYRLYFCLNGGIGRHKRLKISRPFGHAGSSPASGTIILFRHSSVGRAGDC